MNFNRGGAGVSVTVAVAATELIGSKSAVKGEPEAVLVKTPWSVATVTILIVRLPPFGRLANVQLTTPLRAVQVPWEDWALRMLKADGSGSLTVTPVAAD